MATLSIPDGTDTSGGYSLGTLSTTDPDVGDTHTYTINGGADAAKFSIGGTGSDELILTDGTLDRGTKATYVVEVRATDAGSLTYDEEFTITVTLDGGLVVSPAQPAARTTAISAAMPASLHPVIMG